MKQTLRCPKCQHNRILYIAQVSDQDGQWGEKPAQIAVVPKEGRGILTGNVYTTFESAGDLEAGVCRSCGYTEFYTKNPGDIPIDGQYVREVVGPEPPPYR